MSFDKEQLSFLADLDGQIEKLRKCEVLTEEQVTGRPRAWPPLSLASGEDGGTVGGGLHRLGRPQSGTFPQGPDSRPTAASSSRAFRCGREMFPILVGDATLAWLPGASSSPAREQRDARGV